MRKMKTSLLGVALLFALGIMSNVPGAQGAEEKAETGAWTGELGCAKCNFSKISNAKSCGSSLKVGEACYLIKASDKGGPDLTKKVSVGCNNPTKGQWKLEGKIVKDKDGKSWIVADSATPVKGEGNKSPAKKNKKEGSH